MMLYRMAYYILLFTLFVAGCGQHQADKGDEASDEPAGPAQIAFEQVYYDFGDLQQGEKVSYVFEFKNEGGSPLVIRDAAASCGCTVPRYNKEPIQPGEEGSIEVVFDSSGRRGNQYKTVIVKTNTPKREVRLTIKANVIV